MSYLGLPPTSSGGVNKYEYVATAGQTVFGVVYDTYVEVYINGVRLASSGYTATDGFTIVLADPCSAGDNVLVTGCKDTSYNKNIRETLEYVATAGQTTFPIAYRAGVTDLFVNGVKLASSAFTVPNGSSVVLNQARSAGDIVTCTSYLYSAVADTYSQAAVNTLLAGKMSTTGNETVAGTKTLTDGLVVGSGSTIQGDFSNATIGSRTKVQSSTVNGATAVEVVPNGTGADSTVTLANENDNTNCSILQMTSNAATTLVRSGVRGTGTQLPLALQIGTTTYAQLETTGDFSLKGTGYFQSPVGTTAERPSTPAAGMLRYNSSTSQFEGYSSAWGSIGGGATGGGNDQIFNLNGQTVTADYTIPSGKNAVTAGDVTIATGVTVTIPTGSKWVIV